MADMIDRKFKEDSPLNTVSRIRNALLHAGIFTVEAWTDSGIEGCYSVRIEIAGTHVGQNGKGVTRELALASGYAELMERIQSGYFYVGAMDQELQAERGFIYSPGEKEFTVDEYAGQYGDILKPVRDRMCGSSEKTGIKDLLDGCKYGETLNVEKDFSALPFVNLDGSREVYFPVPILLDIYAANGTCAGNVKREAIVQGLSEIIERNHNLQVLTEGMTPPTIPEDYLKQFPIYSVIQEIRRDGRCTLIVKDCSFGTGFPVIASILTSRKSHKYIVKFGAHPVFEIALERTLTEMLQGRNIEDAANASTVADTLTEAGAYDNVHNVLKNASGKYHYRLFCGKPDREFLPFPDRTGMDNQQLYDYCAGLFREWGYEIYIRSCGFLGFPSYQIVVPGFSEIYHFGIRRLKEKSSQKKAGQILCRLDKAAESQLNSLFVYMRFKENFSMENTLSFTLRQPLMLEQKKDVSAFFQIEMCIAIRLQKWREALWCAHVIETLDETLDAAEKAVYMAIQDMAKSMIAGCEKEDVLRNAGLFYDRDVTEKIERIWNWDFCAKEISRGCQKLLFQNECSAYAKLKEVKYKLKETQEAWHESCNRTKV